MQMFVFECDEVGEALCWLQSLGEQAENRTIRIVVDLVTEEDVDTELAPPVNVYRGGKYFT